MAPCNLCVVLGISKGSFEGLICSIDTHTQLYAVTRNGTYNQRAVSSLACETVFGEITSMDPSGKGCPKAGDIGRIIGNLAFLAETRLDPNRCVHFYADLC